MKPVSENEADVAIIAAESMAGASTGGDRKAGALAESWARRSLARTPESYEAGLALGVALMSQNKLNVAELQLDRVINFFPTAPQPYIQRGIARFGQRDLVGAREDLTTARQLNPANPTAPQVLQAVADQLSDAASQ